MPEVFDTAKFIERAKEKHGDKYDYSKSVYKNFQTRVIVICPEHGEWKPTPAQHIHYGNACPQCAKKTRNANISLGKERFIERSKKKHGDKYDYSKVLYVDHSTRVIINCPIHGDFEQMPASHIRGWGCIHCGGNAKSNTEEFVAKAKVKHGDDRYDYSKSIYTGANNKLVITCKTHGDFEQLARNHLYGKGCPVCSASQAEVAVEEYLKQEGYKYETQVEYLDCKDQKVLPFDFRVTLEDGSRILLEIDGDQHRRMVFTQEAFEYTQRHDKIKNDYCLQNGIKLIRLEYTDRYSAKVSVQHVLKQLRAILD